jgi:uncharacterized membrane protein HdeD (DUF308 family)
VNADLVALILVGTKKQKSTLVLATLALVVVIFAVWHGHASLYEIHQVFGVQARLFGILNIIFSIALFVTYFRPGNKS